MSLFVEGVLPLASVIVAMVGSAATVVVDWAKEKWRKRFREQLKAAVTRQSLNYADLQHVAERWNQDRKAVLQALRVLLSESVSGDDSSLAERTDFIRQLLMEHQSREPYAELPENISLQLSAITPSLQNHPQAVPQLAASLSELYSKNQRELQRQKKLAVWGFIVGVLGLLASVPGIITLFKP